MPSENSYVCTISREQADSLKNLLLEKEWSMDAVPYSLWRGRHAKLCVVAYQSGKLTIQGQGTGDFVRFTLEPEILHTARFGYETELAQIENPEMFEPHAGIDESGKGDYFGPLVIACAYTDAESAQVLIKAGVADSKTIKSESKIMALDEIIRKHCAGKFAVVSVGPEAYNRLYNNIGNLNRLLAWGHAKALEELLTKVPSCPRAISDQFSKSEWTVRNALQQRGRNIILEQHPRAEADVAVAAASILARAEFVRVLKKLGENAGHVLPKGGGPAVKQLACEIASAEGYDALAKIAKLHFSITEEALSYG